MGTLLVAQIDVGLWWLRRISLVASVIVCLCACTTHGPWRITDIGDDSCASTPTTNLVEEIDAHTTLAFVEFTERGNLFNRGCVQKVYDHIEAQVQARASDSGVAIVLFVHGWKHNAGPEDDNVKSFRRVLQDYSRSQFGARDAGAEESVATLEGEQAPRAVVGVYIGWRGAVYRDVPVVSKLENLTYWDRKAVAKEVGKGGMTEVILTLARLADCGSTRLDVICPDAEGKNVFLAIGHSFGGAIVLSAMSEIVLDRLLQAERAGEASNCITTPRLSDGVILLNPAVEANELLQVKERISDYCFTNDQDVLMHIISSRGDSATHASFPAGQAVGTLFFHQHELTRSDAKQREVRRLSERDLDLKTVGNYPGFWTGILNNENGSWRYQPLVNRTKPEDIDGKPIENHIFAPTNSPVQVIYTSKDFIEDHSDVFNHKVMAYSSAVVNESMALVRKRPVRQECTNRGRFDFGRCFGYHLERLDPDNRPQESAPITDN